MIFFLSVEPAGRFRYVSVNPAFHAATGLSDEQVIGKLVEEVVPSPLLSTVLSKFGEAIRSGQPVSWEEVSADKSGERARRSHGNFARGRGAGVAPTSSVWCMT